jgi:hypothetical protein
MHFRAHQVSRIERLASLAAATIVTVGTALLVLAGLASSFVSAPAASLTLDTRQLSEHVVYLVPPVRAPVLAATVMPTRQAARSSAGAQSGPVAMSPARAGVTAPRIDSAAPAPAPTTSPSRAMAGAPIAAAMVAIKHANPEPVRIDSFIRELSDRVPLGIVKRPPVPLPATQEEKDVKWRDQAFEAVVARSAGAVAPYKMAGASIPVPLPFGGPSRKQRERDRALFAELLVTVGRRQQRVDSIAAARRARHADSLGVLTDSLHPGTPPKP